MLEHQEWDTEDIVYLYGDNIPHEITGIITDSERLFVTGFNRFDKEFEVKFSNVSEYFKRTK